MKNNLIFIKLVLLKSTKWKSMFQRLNVSNTSPESTHDYEFPSKYEERVRNKKSFLRKKNNRSMHLVAYSSGSSEPRSTEETRDHLDNPPLKATCSSL